MDQSNVLYNFYDQAGQRTVKQLNKTIPNTQGGESIHITKNLYPASLYEEETKGLAGDEQNWQTKKTRHITLGNQTLAHIDVNPQGQAEKILVFSDHLGSSSLLTDNMGRVKTLYDYYPFGSTRLDSSDGLHVSAYQYTGKELDEETGLNYYGARYYAAGVGRFTQVDPRIMNAVADILSDPQALNGYAYARNNPIRYIDPTGETFGEFLGGAAKGFWKGLQNLAYGVTEVIQNPTVLVTGLVDFFGEAYNSASDLMQMYIDDPQGTIDQVKEACAYLVKGWENLSDEQKGQIVGYALEKSAEAYFAAKGASKVVKGKEPVGATVKSDVSLDLSKVPKHARRVSQYDSFKVLDNNRIRYYSEFKPAKTQGPTAGARYVTEVDASTGEVTRTWQELYDNQGNVTEVHPKTPNDLGHIETN